jgi:uncharacterized protein (DUF58 family)
LGALKKILIKTRRQIFSEISGNNTSIFEGEGFDFVELREYNHGDDVRRIDWNVTAKMQRPFIKIFKEERELNIAIVSLLGGSVYFGSQRLKQEVIAEIVALLAFSSVKNGDKFSSYIYTEEIAHILRPTKNIHAVHKAVASVMDFKPLGHVVDSKALTKKLFEKIKRRSILFIIGDFFEEFDFKLLAKKHEVVAIMVRDRFEENPPELGTINLADPSSYESQLFSLDAKAIKRYKERVHQSDHAFYGHCRKNQIAFTKIYSDEDPFVKLSKLFLKR